MKKKLVLIMALIVIGTTACAPMDSNFNKFEQKLLETQNNLKVDLELIEDTFYNKNLIRKDQVYKMPETNYLVFYFNEGNTLREKEFQELINEYRKDKDSFIVYVVNTDDEVKLEFVVRKQKEYIIEDIWYEASEAEMLPYKGD